MNRPEMSSTTTDHGDRKPASRFFLSYRETLLLVAGLAVLSLPLWMRVPRPEDLVSVEGRLTDFRSDLDASPAYVLVRLAEHDEWFALSPEDLPVVEAMSTRKGVLAFHANHAALREGGVRTYGLVANGSTIRTWTEELQSHRSRVRWTSPGIAAILFGVVAISRAHRRAKERQAKL